jgi:hypothetical protein
MRTWIAASTLALAFALAPAAALSQDGGGYVVEGTVQTVELDEVRIARPGKPVAELDLRPETTILLDGRGATATELRPGQQIRATFELYGDDPVALRVEATSGAAAR